MEVIMKTNKLMAAAVLVLTAAKAQALQLAVLIPLSVSAIPATTFWGGSYSSSKNSQTFPDAVRAGDDTVREIERTIGIKLHREVIVGARAEAQTFLANNDSLDNVQVKYPMLSAAVEEATRQGAGQGLLVNPYSVAEAVANFTEL
jgi:hypothetical protein